MTAQIIERFTMAKKKVLVGMDLTKNEAAIYLQASLSTINRYIKGGLLSPIRKPPGKSSRVLIPAATIIDFQKQTMLL